MITKEEKQILYELTQHRGWKILKLVEEERQKKLGLSLLNADLENKDHLKVLKDNQIYIKAIKDFIVNIEKQNLDIIENDERLF